MDILRNAQIGITDTTLYKCIHCDIAFNHCGLYIHYIDGEDFYWLFTYGDETYSGYNISELYDIIKTINKELKDVKKNKDIFLISYCWNIDEIKVFFDGHTKNNISEVIIDNTLLLRDVRGIVPCTSIEEFANDWLKKDIMVAPSILFADFSNEAYNEYTVFENGKGKVFKTCAQSAKYYIKSKLPSWQPSYMTKRIPYIEEYNFIRNECFRASLCMNNNPIKVYKNVKSFDQSSAHAHKLICKEFPISRPIKAAMNQTIEWYFEHKWCWFVAHIKGCSKKVGFEHLDPFKTYGQKELYIPLDLLQLEAFNLFYDYDSIEYLDLIISDKGYVQDELRCAIADMYLEKSMYKTKDAHRNKLKVRLNSGSYGISVERIYEDIDKLTNSQWNNIWSKRLIPPQVGVSITSYVFLDECKIIAKNPDCFAYCDTDSVKFESCKEIEEAIKIRNKESRREVKEFCDKYNYDYDYMKDLGYYVYEGTYKLFKSVSPKEYIYLNENDELGATTAGYAKHYKTDGIDYKFDSDKIQAILYEPCSKGLDPFRYFTKNRHYTDYRWLWDEKTKRRKKAYFKLTIEENAKLHHDLEENYKKVTQK